METTVGLYGKGNEIIFRHLLCVGSCLVLNSNYTCIIVIEAHCTKSVRIELVMTTFARVWKPSLVMTISTCFCMWQRKRWKTFLCMWAPFFDVIITTIFQSISWVVVHPFLHGQHSKWISKSWMVWPHRYHKICSTIKWGISKQI
jgi:hypothetical protein